MREKSAEWQGERLVHSSQRLRIQWVLNKKWPFFKKTFQLSFQIEWHLTPLLVKNCRKLARLGILPILKIWFYWVFGQHSTVFFWLKRGAKCYSIWILRPYLKSSHHLVSLRNRTPFDDFHILIFWPPMLLFDHKFGRGIFFFRKCKFRMSSSWQR